MDRLDRPAFLADATEAQVEARIRPMFDERKLVFYNKDDWRPGDRTIGSMARPNSDRHQWTGVTIFRAYRPS